MSTLKTACFIYNHKSPYNYLTKDCIDRINRTDGLFVINCGSEYDQQNDFHEITKPIYNDGDNGRLNPYIGEMTGMGWLFDNYEKIGNPDYICTCHYRRFFHERDIADFENFDIISSSNKNIFPYSMLRQYSMNRNHDIELFKYLINILPEKVNVMANAYFNDPMQVFKQCNMFVMRKELFAEYFGFISGLIKKALDWADPWNTLKDKPDEDKRTISFAIERFTSFFIDYLVISKRLRHKICFDIEFYRTKPW